MRSQLNVNRSTKTGLAKSVQFDEYASSHFRYARPMVSATSRKPAISAETIISYRVDLQINMFRV